jgi:NADH dehydrogenase [ubiquinone] 1 alpha subcomplex assembly factor 7
MIPISKVFKNIIRQETERYDPTLSFVTRLKETIRATASINIEKFMTLAVEHYYATRDQFGVNGDFTTAPEISQMFGELIGAWTANEWIALGRPNPFTLMECGPGRGTLMADILRATKKIDGFHDALRLVLMETSPVLKENQKKMLASYHPTWIGNLDDPIIQSSKQPIILIANEFLDALPIRQFQETQDGWQERMVSLTKNDEFIFSYKSLPPNSHPKIKVKSDDNIVELSPIRESFVRDICVLLKKNKGTAVFIDYGHTESGAGDTLQAVKNHRFVPVLENIGEADLTSHVDFSALRRVAAENGMNCRTLATQGEFLRSFGVEHRAEVLMRNASNIQKEDIQTALNRLIGTEEMGDLFKVMILDSEG